MVLYLCPKSVQSLTAARVATCDSSCRWNLQKTLLSRAGSPVRPQAVLRQTALASNGPANAPPRSQKMADGQEWCRPSRASKELYHSLVASQQAAAGTRTNGVHRGAVSDVGACSGTAFAPPALRELRASLPQPKLTRPRARQDRLPSNPGLHQTDPRHTVVDRLQTFAPAA